MGFEGTIVLERLARIDKVDEFFDAVDSDDLRRARSLMEDAGIDEYTIAIVLRMIQEADEH